MFKIAALIFISTQATGEPAGVMLSMQDYESKAACEEALKSDFVKKQNEALKARFTELGKAKKITFKYKFECRAVEKKDDGSI